VCEHSVDMENDTTPEKPTDPKPVTRRRATAKPAEAAETPAPTPAPRRRRPAQPVDETIVITLDDPVVEVVQEPKPSRLAALFAGSIPTKAAAGVAVVAGVAGGITGASVGVLSNGGFGFNSVVQPQVVNIGNTDNTRSVTAVAAKALQSVVTIEVSGSDGGGSGSGVIISDDGYVVTNSHVVTLSGTDSSTDVRVTLADGRLYPAELIGNDPIMDIAVIRIKAENLVAIEWADSSALAVGDEAIAIGAPLGLENTVTDGVVSALNRSITISNDGDGFNFDVPEGQQSAISQALSLPVIQTDASINPGNSGGALLNAEGNLIGINVAIASSGSSAGSIGVGFALPSNLVKRIANELIESGTSRHGRMGAMVSSVIEDTGVVGALVREVDAGSPAAAAGLKANDVITVFNGIPIRNEIDVTAQVRSLVPGTTVDMVVVRDGTSRTLTVTVGSLE
jgi:putative serine protease PepD